MNGAPPLVTEVSRPWWEGLGRGVIVMQRCEACTAWIFYPRPFCPVCGSRSLEWLPVEPRATLYTYSIAHVPVSLAFAHFDKPILAVAEFGNGVRVPTRLIDVAPAAVGIGMTLVPVFDRATYPEVTLLLFRPA